MQWKKLNIPHDLERAWFAEQDIRLPVEDGIMPSVKIREGGAVFNFNADAVINTLREEAYADRMSSPTNKLPFSYIYLPAFFRLLAAKCVYLPKRFFRNKKDPSWPIAPGQDVLLSLMGKLPSALWADNKWGLNITHDVDTVNGLRCSLKIADAVEKTGFRSCFYIVGSVILQEPGIVRELHERGHEIGSHDVEHDNRICFLPHRDMADRIRKAKSIIEPYNGSGFRSPSLLRSAEMIEVIGQHFLYDSSICDTDLEYYRGCTTVFPYYLRSCLEVPITLPMDSSLLYTGYKPSGMLELWKLKCEYIRKVGGLAVLINHAEPHLSGGESLMRVFIEFLKWLKDQSDLTVLLPFETAEKFKYYDVTD